MSPNTLFAAWLAVITAAAHANTPVTVVRIAYPTRKSKTRSLP